MKRARRTHQTPARSVYLKDGNSAVVNQETDMHPNPPSTHEAAATTATAPTGPETLNATETTRGCPFSWHYEQGFFVKTADSHNDG